ncbi:MAG: hypothetical protein HY885_16745 [Deltaproteobacteria bacterium]|nr:hypothetical protein [Deltaproteobacteria bacterium]
MASLFFLAATVTAACSMASAAESLTSRAEQKPRAGKLTISAPVLEPIKNPHDMECNKCHVQGQDGKTEEGLIQGDDSITLCRGCHAGAKLHPVGLLLQVPSSDTGDFPLPLGKGLYQGAITCLTCHYLHSETYNRCLLRSTGGEASQGARNALCATCHKNHFVGLSPHTEDKNSCIFCHTATPEKRKNKGKMKDDEIDALCIFCHWSLVNAHYKDLNPFVDPVVQQWIDSSSRMVEGEIFCLSCHVAHGKGEGKNLLTSQYLRISSLSRSINPHWKNVMCIACHQGTPAKGNPSLLGNGDINEICNRCHKSEFARAEMHPVGIIPSKNVKIPEDMPLQNGKLSCETCHQSSLQESALALNSVGKDNPKFLRRSGLSRNQFCFLCHFQEAYRRLNPHQQLTKEGHIKKETCLFCHASLPDIYIFGPNNVIFIVDDPNEYCIGCHPGFKEAHPAGGRHLVKPSDKIMKALSTSINRIGVELPLYNGKIVCATCHNPHEKGVIKYPASAEGSQRKNKLRLMPGIIQCTGCHLDKI